MLGAGKDETSTNEADYQAALKVALSVKPAIKTINSTYIERLSQGQIDIGLGWNGDVLRGKLAAAKKGIEIGFTGPTARASTGPTTGRSSPPPRIRWPPTR